MPNKRQLVYTALNVRFAAASLAIIILSGLTDEFKICNPKYLNYFTVFISLVHTYIY